MTPAQAQVAEALVECAPPVIARLATEPRRCLLATALGLEVLRYYEVPARPVLAFVGALNAAWCEHVERRHAAGLSRLPEEDLRATGAHCVIASQMAVGPGISGHVLLRLPGALVDLDMQQFRRPQHAIHVPDAAVLEYADGKEYSADLRATTTSYGLEGGGALVVQVVPGEEPWLERRAKDWHRTQRGVYRAQVGEIIRAMRVHLTNDKEEVRHGG